MKQQFKSEMQQVLDVRLDGRAFDSRAVFLFGHCNATEELADYLLSKTVVPTAIFDNSISKQGLAYREIPIVPPERIKEYAPSNSVVLIATRFYAEMSAQLRQLGYGGEIVKVVEYNSFAEYSLSDGTVQQKAERMRRGIEALEKIREQYPEQHLVICPNDALGDVYWAMAFLPAYCNKKRIKETCIIVIGDGCRQVAQLFGVKNTVAIGNTEMDEFIQAVIFTREENCIIGHHDRPYTDNIIKWLDKRFLSFIDYYRCAVYGLANDVQPDCPANIEPFENTMQINKGKSVILSPHAKSVVELQDGFWENLAKEYAGQGFSVYTNTIGGEAPVSGTASLYVPISQIISAAEHAGTFVGIRSGLCDILYTANCRKVVVFPNCYYSTTPHKVEDFFALPKWEQIVCSE